MGMSCWAQSSGCLSPGLLAVLPSRAASLEHLDQAQPMAQGQHLPPLQQSQVVTGGHLLKLVVMSELCVSLSCQPDSRLCVCYQVESLLTVTLCFSGLDLFNLVWNNNYGVIMESGMHWSVSSQDSVFQQ